jgi:chromosome segregation ATPase
MKAKRPRGMRELMTIQGIAGRTVPDSREQIVAEQSRLEHERARLRRELEMWQGNLDKTAQRLQGVEDRMTLLRRAIEPMLEPEEAAEPTRRPARAAEAEPEPTTVWHEIVLEY